MTPMFVIPSLLLFKWSIFVCWETKIYFLKIFQFSEKINKDILGPTFLAQSLPGQKLLKPRVPGDLHVFRAFARLLTSKRWFEILCVWVSIVINLSIEGKSGKTTFFECHVHQSCKMSIHFHTAKSLNQISPLEKHLNRDSFGTFTEQN